MKRILSCCLILLLLVGLLCIGTPEQNVGAAVTNVEIPVPDGKTPVKDVHDAGSGYSQLVYTGVSAAQMAAYEQKLLAEGYTLYDQREIANGDYLNRFATYVKGDMMIHLNRFPKLSQYQFHIIYGPADKLVPNTKAPAYTEKVTPSVAIIERTDGELCMVVQLADGSYFIIDGGYGYSMSTPYTIPNKTEHRDGSGVTYTYTRDHKQDMKLLLDYLQDTNRDGKVDSKDWRPQVTWMITHADTDHIQQPYIFMKTYGKKFDLLAVYYNFPNFENIGLKETYNTDNLYKNAWTGFVTYTHTYFPKAKEYVYHTGQVVDLPGCKLEFLYTPEDLYPTAMTSPNHTCGMWRFCFDGGMTFLVTGDAEEPTNRQAAKVMGDYIQSDMMQVIHHGSNGGTEVFYNTVNPDICFWPCLDTSFYHDLRHLGTYSGYRFNAVLRNGNRTHYTTSATNVVFVPTLRYDANGGAGEMGLVGTMYSSTPNEGSRPNGEVAVAESGFTAPAGNVFAGWSTTPNGAVEYTPGDIISIKTNTVLYAVYSPVPTTEPTEAPTEAPTQTPTEKPTEAPTEVPTEVPTEAPTEVPTESLTTEPVTAPTTLPSEEVTTGETMEAAPDADSEETGAEWLLPIGILLVAGVVTTVILLKRKKI